MRDLESGDSITLPLPLQSLDLFERICFGLYPRAAGRFTAIPIPSPHEISLVLTLERISDNGKTKDLTIVMRLPVRRLMHSTARERSRSMILKRKKIRPGRS